jgi:hypothetical protein
MTAPRFKTAVVKFADPKYNYSTSINGGIADEEIIKYFKGNWFNMGNVDDDMQKCVDCEIFVEK